MGKLKAFIGLKVVSFGIWIYEMNMDKAWGPEDKTNLEKLWKYHDEFAEALK